MQSRAVIAMGLVLAAGSTLAQTMTNAPVPTATDTEPVVAKEGDEKAWSFSAAVYTYLVPEDRDYAQPTFTADRDRLHVEARYNYEGLDTGSLWIGCNFSVGEKVSLEFTPMLGGVFGDTAGIAPGYKLTLGWRKLELYSETEYFIDTGDSSENFFHAWSELTVAPADWCRLGLAIQRTKVHETDLDIQRGLLVGFSYKNVDFTTCAFDVDGSQPMLVLGIGLSF